VLNAGTDINVMVGLPEKVINNVVLEMPVEIHFTSINEKYAGRVIEISPVVDQSSSTYPVKIELTSPNDRIKPGMAANVTFDFKKKEKDNDQSIVVPIKAVGEDGAGNFVFIVESREDGTGLVRKQKVEIGDMTSDGFTIVRGLTGGEAIAVAGLQTLVDGQAVSLSSN
jgi:RND family efflux transporter MFP subunit